MTRLEKAKLLKAYWDREYGPLKTFLHYEEAKPWELLFAIMLSAQATDISVNKVTPLLFKAYPSMEDLAEADPKDVEAIVRPVGLAPTKSKAIVKTASILVHDFQGDIPKDRKLLMTLPGVGYKTAGVYLGERYDFPYLPVDTHVTRVSHKMGLVPERVKDPKAIEEKLEALFKGLGNLMATHRQMILFGRRECHPKTDPKALWAKVEEATIAKGGAKQ